MVHHKNLSSVFLLSFFFVLFFVVVETDERGDMLKTIYTPNAFEKSESMGESAMVGTHHLYSYQHIIYYPERQRHCVTMTIQFNLT
jgi:hypothetical protein